MDCFAGARNDGLEGPFAFLLFENSNL